MTKEVQPVDSSSNSAILQPSPYSVFSGAQTEALARDDFTNLAVLLRYAREGSWSFALYSHVSAREEVVSALKTLLQPMPAYEWTYSPERPSPLSYLDSLSEQQRRERAVVFFFDLERAPDAVWKLLDYNRELFSAQPHGLVFWVTSAGRGRAMRVSPHFWSQRSAVFDFRLAPGPLPLLSEWAQRSDVAIDDWENILRQIRITQGLLDELLAAPEVSPSVMATQYLRLGKLSYYVDRLDDARSHLNAAESLAAQTDNLELQANVQKALGDLALREADLGEARRRYEAALAIYPQIGARLGEANVLASLARIEVLDGRSESAMDLLSKAITFYQSLNDRYSIAAQLGNFGLTLRQFGRNDEAKPFLLQSAEIFDEIHLPQYAQQLRRAAS